VGRGGAYLTCMRRAVAVLALTALLTPALAHAQSEDERYNIMRAEPGRRPELPTPWLPPTYKSPRGSKQHVTPLRRPRSRDVRASEPPPPMFVPRTGQVLPNIRTLSPSGPNGTETFQDKALRCVHQSGMYGARAGDPGAYIGECVNQ
jgi:hypothetical protein